MQDSDSDEISFVCLIDHKCRRVDRRSRPIEEVEEVERNSEGIVRGQCAELNLEQVGFNGTFDTSADISFEAKEVKRREELCFQSDPMCDEDSSSEPEVVFQGGIVYEGSLNYEVKGEGNFYNVVPGGGYCKNNMKRDDSYEDVGQNNLGILMELKQDPGGIQEEINGGEEDDESSPIIIVSTTSLASLPGAPQDLPDEPRDLPDVILDPADTPPDLQEPQQNPADAPLDLSKPPQDLPDVSNEEIFEFSLIPETDTHEVFLDPSTGYLHKFSVSPKRRHLQEFNQSPKKERLQNLNICSEKDSHQNASNGENLGYINVKPKEENRQDSKFKPTGENDGDLKLQPSVKVEPKVEPPVVVPMEVPAPALPHGLFVVEALTDYRKDSKGTDLFFMKWKGYDDKTWEPIANLSRCPSLLQKFYLERRTEYFEAQVRNEQTEETLSGDAHRLPLLPPDPRSLDEILEEYTSKFPVQDEEYEELVKEAGRNSFSKPRLSKQTWSHMVAEAIFSIINPDRCAQLRKAVLKVLIRERKMTLDAQMALWLEELTDKAQGRPTIDIENESDLIPPPADFIYLNTSVYVSKPKYFRPPRGCSCAGECFKFPLSCCASKWGSEFACNKYGRLIVCPGTPVFECNDRCDCDASCPNRVVQADGLSQLTSMHFCIFRTLGRGWGLKTVKPIRRGTFVMLLVGEIITRKESMRRQRSCSPDVGKYIFNLGVLGKGDYLLDFSKMGNLSRFINHSCTPNLVLHPNWYDHANPELPRIAFYASKDISAGSELTYSYVDMVEFQQTHRKKLRDGHIPEGFQPCECGSDNCIKLMIFPN